MAAADAEGGGPQEQIDSTLSVCIHSYNSLSLKRNPEKGATMADRVSFIRDDKCVRHVIDNAEQVLAPETAAKAAG
jgi:hypothetical protein